MLICDVFAPLLAWTLIHESDLQPSIRRNCTWKGLQRSSGLWLSAAIIFEMNRVGAQHVLEMRNALGNPDLENAEPSPSFHLRIHCSGFLAGQCRFQTLTGVYWKVVVVVLFLASVWFFSCCLYVITLASLMNTSWVSLRISLIGESVKARVLLKCLHANRCCQICVSLRRVAGPKYGWHELYNKMLSLSEESK